MRYKKILFYLFYKRQLIEKFILMFSNKMRVSFINTSACALVGGAIGKAICVSQNWYNRYHCKHKFEYDESNEDPLAP